MPATVELGGELLAASTHARALRIARLDDKILHHSVKNVPIIEAGTDQLHESADRDRGVRRKELEAKLPFVGRDHHRSPGQAIDIDGQLRPIRREKAERSRY